MKKLIDIPEDIRWELEKQALENKMNLKNYIEFILKNLCGGKKITIMEDFRFTTIEPLFSNADTMDWFINEHFYEVFAEDAIHLKYDDGYAEVIDGKGQKWGLHASSDGDFVSHRIRFEALTKYWC